MATCTAVLMIGHPHPNDGGLYNINQLRFCENSRPSWQVSFGAKKHAWIPERIETMIPDGILMASLLVVESESLFPLVPTTWKGQFRIDLGNEDRNQVKQMREKLVEIDFRKTTRTKFILTLFDGCSLTDLSFFNELNCDVEILKPAYTRCKSQWDQDVVIKGEI